MLRLFDWVRALSQFEHGGDYGVFARLLAKEGREEFESPMREATFFERTTRDILAKEKIDTVYKDLRQIPLTGIAGLFQSTLQDRLAWVREDNPQQRRRALASRYEELRKLISKFLDEFPDN